MNDKKTKKTSEQKKHVFQIHTMHSDNEIKVAQVASPSAPASLPMVKNNLSQNTKKVPVPKKQKTKTRNPFLVMDDNQKTKNDIHKEGGGSFAPGKKLVAAEKINYTPADIVRDKKTSKQPQKNSHKKTTYIIMIIFVIVFLLGAVGFGVYMLYFNNTQQTPVEDVGVGPDSSIDVLVEDDDSTAVVKIDETKPVEQSYAINLPNYFSFDVESQSAARDIATELEAIAINMQNKDVAGPISFIVTDVNNNPVSFNTFALSAEMNIPQDILTSLEEEFEIYAFTDEFKGVRFGFAIDAKNTDTLQVALSANESMLPEAFNIILNNLGTSVTGVVFNDNTYGTHPIRYYNLNELETYSVDYTINNQRFVMGTTKNTLRAIIDALKDAQIPQDINENLND